MSLNIFDVLRGVFSIAGTAGGCPVAAVLSTIDALTGQATPQPAPAEDSPITPALNLAMQVAQAHSAQGGQDPLAVVGAVLQLVHPEPVKPAVATAPVDPERAKVLADRQKLQDGLSRIQALIAQMKARKST